MRMTRFLESLKARLRDHKVVEVREMLGVFHVADVAEIMEELDNEESLLLFRYLPKDFSAELFSYMTLEQQMQLIDSFTDREVTTLIESIDTDVAADVLDELPANFVQRLLAKTKPEIRNKLNRFLQYEEFSAGSVMTDLYVRLKKSMRVDEAIAKIRADKLDLIVSTLYVVSETQKLEGVISIRELLTSEDDQILEDIMTTNIISVNTDSDQEEAVQIIRKYDFQALPVTDSENRLVGIITHDDAMDIADEETTEDFEKMAAIAPSERTYFATDPVQHAKNRMPWLIFLLISGMFNGWVLSQFEGAFTRMAILVTFIPMLMGTGGNVGSQSSTLVIRGLSLGDIKMEDLPRVIWHEFRVAILVGLGLAIFAFLKITLLDQSGLWVGLTVGISIFTLVNLSEIIGGVLPIIAKKLGLDPALMASPLISTITDTASLVIYFSIAKLIFGL